MAIKSSQTTFQKKNLLGNSDWRASVKYATVSFTKLHLSQTISIAMIFFSNVLLVFLSVLYVGPRQQNETLFRFTQLSATYTAV